MKRPIRTWRNGASVPNDFPTIERELFGAQLAYIDWRQELRDAYDAAKRLRDSTRQITHERRLSSYNAREDWVIEGGKSSLIIELRMHPPRMGNEADTFYVDATLVAGVAPYVWDGETVFIGVKETIILLESEDYQPAKGSMLGQRRIDSAPQDFTGLRGAFKSLDLLTRKAVLLVIF